MNNPTPAWTDEDMKNPWGAEAAFLRHLAVDPALNVEQAALLRHCAKRLQSTSGIELRALADMLAPAEQAGVLRAAIDTSYTPPPAGDAISLIATERRRQIEAEGWTPEHDDQHDTGELADAASCYASARPGRSLTTLWPWGRSWWKPSPDDRIRELVKAGALIVAEIERLQRRAGKRT